jgi:hypothetical protein
MKDRIIQSLNNLLYWVRENKYYGYDPYDGLNSNLFKNIRNPYLAFLLIQFNKYCPINFRPLFRIKKGIDIKGTALFTIGYTYLHDFLPYDVFLDEAKNCLEIIIKKSLISKYGHHCWASHYYPYVAVDKSILDPMIPDIIATTRAIISLIRVYSILREERIKNIALNAAKFITSINFVLRKGSMLFFKYTPLEDRKIILNASAQALEAIATILSIMKDDELRSIGENSAISLIKLQNDDGSWDYSIYENGRRYRQLDFHQGYMIDGLLAFLPFASSDIRDDIKYAIESGVKFYRKMFLPNGQSFYRYPKLYPTDIHNQAQGIITFSKLFCELNEEEHLRFAQRILLWTIENMQDPMGFFYYQNYRFFKNKIPYMRWGQAWMMLAMAIFLSSARRSK